MTSTQVCNFNFGSSISGSGSVFPKEVEVDANGNSYVVGSLYGTSDFDPGPGTANFSSNGGSGNGDIFLAKYDNNGDYLWARIFGAIGDDQGNSVCIDANGDVLITGQFQYTVDFDPGSSTALFSASDRNIFFAKYNTDGDLIWAKGLGGMGFETGSFIQTDQAGNVYITGFFLGPVDFDPGLGNTTLTSSGSSGFDIYFAKYTSTGSFVWAKSIECPDHSEEPYGIEIDASSNIFLTGRFIGTGDFDPGTGIMNLSTYNLSWGDVFLSKYNSDGNYVWAANAITGPSSKTVGAITIDSEGNIILTGDFNPGADFDPGLSNTNTNALGLKDAFIAKYDGAGNYLWVINFGGDSSDKGHGIATNSNNDIYVTGNFCKKTDFDPGVDSSIINVTTASQVFIAMYNKNGAFLWARALIDNPSGGSGGSYDMSLTSSEDLFVTGNFVNTIDLDPNSSIENRACGGTSCGFIGKYSKLPIGLDEIGSETEGVIVFPNPSTGKFKVGTNCHITISTVTGKYVFEKDVTFGDEIITELEGGIYLLSLKTSSGTFNRKLIVEK